MGWQSKVFIYNDAELVSKLYGADVADMYDEYGDSWYAVLADRAVDSEGYVTVNASRGGVVDTYFLKFIGRLNSTELMGLLDYLELEFIDSDDVHRIALDELSLTYDEVSGLYFS